MNQANLKCAFRLLSLAVWLPTLITITGCKKSPSPPSNLAEAQRIYSQTWWYWAKTTADLTNLSEQGFQYYQSKPGDQAFMTSSNGTRILYTELSPGSGIKAFTGMGTLQQITGITQPIYQLNYHTSKVGVVGFGESRIFHIEAEGESPETALRDAIITATNALQSIEKSLK